MAVIMTRIEILVQELTKRVTFSVNMGDAIPSCAKSQSRNSFCIDFTGNVNSVCPSGGGNCVAVDPPTSPPSTQQYPPPCGSSVPLTSRV